MSEPTHQKPTSGKRPNRSQELSPRRKFVYWLISVSIGLCIVLVVTEIGAYVLLKSEGAQSSLFFKRANETILGRDQFREAYRTLDPHLAFTYGKNSDRLREVEVSRRWVDGFLIHSPLQGGLRRPVILALGGSTTDGVKFDNSWPEQLARMLDAANIPASVINGGIGGYTTSQDMFKLIRDGFEFKPDIIIEYAGVNDGWRYGIPQHLMIHPYQENILKVATGQEDARILPNMAALLRKYFPLETSIDYSLGISSNRSRAQTYKKNMEIMNAASSTQGAKFYAVIQPFSYFRSKHARPNPQSVGTEFITGVNGLYNQILALATTADYIHDATQSLESTNEIVYQPDGVHLTNAGNRMIAQFMFNMIRDQLPQPQQN